MLGVLCWTLLFIGVTPESTWRELVDSRVARSNRDLSGPGWSMDRQSPLALQEWLLTLGQNGDPGQATRIKAFFDHQTLQASALFAYGELDGAPLEPLWSVREKIAPANLKLYVEALSKLAEPADAERLATFWSTLPEDLKAETLFFLWRRPSETLTAQVKSKLTQRPASGDSGYVYYLFRARVETEPELLSSILGFFKEPQTLMYALRIAPTEAAPALGKACAALCGADDWRLRVNALNALSGRFPKLAESRARGLIRDSNPNVVRTAVGVLARLEDPAVDAFLLEQFPGLSASQKQTVMAAAGSALADRLWPLLKSWKDADTPWRRRQWFGFAGKAGGDEAEQALLARFERGGAEATLAFNALRQRGYGQLDGLIPQALASGDNALMTAAVEAAAAPEAPTAASRLETLAKLASRNYVDVDFHYAYLRALNRLMPESQAARVLSEMRAHPNYLVRLGALNATPEPDPAMRAAIVAKGWSHRLDPELTALAARMMGDGDGWRWRLQTARGEVVIHLSAAYAPITCANIVRLARKGYFDGVPFHRVVPNFVAQGGDVRGDGSGGPGYHIPCEINPMRYRRGSVGMALSGKDTGGGQFFICHSEQPHLDGGYTLFGHVVEGMWIVDLLEEGDAILTSEIERTAGR